MRLKEYGFVWSFAFMVWILYLPLIAISPFIHLSHLVILLVVWHEIEKNQVIEIGL